MRAAPLLVLLHLAAQVAVCCGESFIDNLFDANSWSYLARFCFQATTPDTVFRSGSIERGEPRIEYQVDYPLDAKPTLAFYYSDVAKPVTGQNVPWSAVHDSKLGCHERLLLANFRIELWKESNMNQVTRATNFFIGTAGANRATGVSNFDTATPRWFYAVVAHCDSDCETLRRANYVPGTPRVFCEAPVHVQYVRATFH